MEQQALQLILRSRKHLGDIKLVNGAGLHPDRRNQHDMWKPLGHFGRHLGGDPTTHRRSDQIDLTQAEVVEQFEVHVRDIVDAVEPIGKCGATKAWMRRHDHAPAPRHKRQERIIGPNTTGTMQKQDRCAGATLEQLDIDAGDRNGRHTLMRYIVHDGRRVLPGWHLPMRFALTSLISASRIGTRNGQSTRGER